ncbi:hypothetical protein UCCLB556_1948 [Levilactobacillus brevis]|nr:hypothetical protein UCCLB556_1948 [Levilactobacillus brevis]
MINKLTMRRLERNDIPALIEIVKRSWRTDEFLKIRSDHDLATVFFWRCVVHQNFAKVALWDGKVVGFILADTKRYRTARTSDVFRSLTARWKLGMRNDGKAKLKLLKQLTKIDDELLEKLNWQDYLGEIVLLAVDPDYQNIGIGKQLVQSVMQYWREKSVERFYTFTDTESNYQFCLKSGFSEYAREKVTITKTNGKFLTAKFFLYTGEVSTL